MTRRSLGQHYLTDPDVVRKMVDAAEIKRRESVLEIGTGKGILTERIAGLGSKFDGYEIDPANYRETLRRVEGTAAAVHLTDAFEVMPSFDVLVSSLPYSRSSDFVEWISQVKYNRAIVLLQEDFVKKVLSPPGSRDYRAVSAVAQISSEFNEIGRVGRRAFQPPPKVNSVIMAITPKVRLAKEQISTIKRVFSLRRREVRSVLSELGLSGSGIDYGRRRVFSLSPDEVYRLCAGSRST